MHRRHGTVEHVKPNSNLVERQREPPNSAGFRIRLGRRERREGPTLASSEARAVGETETEGICRAAAGDHALEE